MVLGMDDMLDVVPSVDENRDDVTPRRVADGSTYMP
jgi:hypothetical protein